jgi:single-strand DNA-binding protein
MSFDQPELTMTGNLTADPELRFTTSGIAVAAFTVAWTPQVKQGDKWTDDTDHALFLRCTAWRYLAEHVTASLSRGDRVTVRGTLRGNTWQDKETGDKRTSVELTCTDVGTSLQYATAAPKKATRSSGPAPTDPYTGEAATERERPTSAASTGGSGFADEPPF